MGTTATAEMLLLLLALVFAAAVRTSEPQQKDEDSVVGRRVGRGLYQLDRNVLAFRTRCQKLCMHALSYDLENRKKMGTPSRPR